jgi:hypothetical protein
VTRPRILFLLALLGLTLLGLAVIWIMTPYGTALSFGDSVSYFIPARSLAHGNGFLMSDRSIYVRWPPLFPMLIAIPIRLGVEGTHSVRIVNSIAYALTILTSGLVLERVLRSRLLALLGTVAVLVGWPVLLVAYFGLSESLFGLMLIAFILFLIHYLEKPTPRRLVTLALVTSLAMLQRYVGVSLIAAAALSILFLRRDAPLATRLRDVVVMGVIAVLPFSLWIVRNLVVTGTIVGNDWEHFRDMLNRAPDLMVNWLWPEANVKITSSPIVGILLATGAVSLLAIAAVWLAARNRFESVTRSTMAQTQVIAVGLTLVVYTITFMILASVIHVDVTERIFAPMFAPTMVLLFSLADSLASQIDARVPKRLGTAAVATLVVLWLVRPTNKIIREVNTLSQNDFAMGYNNLSWRGSPLVKWLGENPVEGRLFSNADYPVTIVSGLYLDRAAHNLDDWQNKDIQPDEDVYFAWFSDVEAYGCNSNSAPCFEPNYSMDELKTLFDVEPVVQMDDGTVYRLTRSGE